MIGSRAEYVCVRWAVVGPSRRWRETCIPRLVSYFSELRHRSGSIDVPAHASTYRQGGLNTISRYATVHGITNAINIPTSKLI